MGRLRRIRAAAVILDRLDPGDEVEVHWERDGKRKHARTRLVEVQ